MVLRTFTLALALCLLAGVSQAHTIFDNGASSGGQDNLRNTASQNQRLYEDFTLGTANTITGINWQQHDHNAATYLSTEITIYDGLPQVGTLLYSANHVATRTANATGTIFGNWDGFDYSLGGLSISLAAGTYWIGINQNHTGISPGWDQTLGGPDTIPGHRLINATFPAPAGKVFSTNRAFNLVPEPSTLAFLGLGVLAVVRKRRKKTA